ncbi:tetratricopeptide repeat protein [Bosea beijingensis]|uniref:tetratricopeptide repeat protein n=1 Tax=Bosea beijingensis TaxID=3068632 RepID=UPI0027407D98|nr:tetratricopeptide repeat protein [Bosea sp. REN20]
MPCSLWRIAFLVFALSLLCAVGTRPAFAQKAGNVALCKDDRTEKGLAACNALLKGRPDRKVKAMAHVARGHTQLALGRPAEAEKDYTEALVIAPKFAALYRDRGRVRFTLGNRDGAMADFTAAIENDPFDPDNHANRGYLRLLQYDFAGAGEDLRKGLFWQKQHPRSDYLLGLLAYATGRYTDAVAQIDKGREGGFRTSETFITRARSLYYLGMFEAAAKEASEGLVAFPKQVDLIEIRARARLARREWPEALVDAEVVAEAQPRFGRAYATRGAVKLAMKDVAAATADADKAIELDPGLFDAHELKAEILLAAGDQPGARAILARSAARTDAKMAYDIASRERHAARVAEFDKPKPIVVADLDEAELKKRCATRDDPLRMQSCDRLVETAATPQDKAGRLIERAKVRPFDSQMGDYDLAVAAAPEYLPATLARAYAHMRDYRYGKDLTPFDRAWGDADSVVRRSGADKEMWAQAMLARASVSLGRGNYEAAVADLSELVASDPQARFYRADRASAFLMAGKPAQALEDLRERAQLPTEVTGQLGEDDLVVALIETGAFDEAVSVLDNWRTNRLPGAYAEQALRARVALARGDVAAARELAAAALTDNRFNIAAQAVRGLAAARLGDALEAESDLSKVIDDAAPIPFRARTSGLTPGHVADLFLWRGIARVQLNRVNAARGDFAEVIKRAPDRAQAYAERAKLNLRSDNPAALTDIAMALRIEPNEPRWQALAARINLATGDAAAAERFAAAALAAPSPEADMLLLRAKARLGLGRFPEAAEDATARLAAAPNDAEALLLRSDARIGQGDATAALADIETAIGVKAGDPRLLLARAELKAKLGDVPGAIGAFEAAMARPEASLQANKRLGDLYAGIASDQLALGYYAKALEQPARAPSDEAIRDAARNARDALIRRMAAPK